MPNKKRAPSVHRCIGCDRIGTVARSRCHRCYQRLMKVLKATRHKLKCLGCGEEFFSASAKKFCGMRCYTSSAYFLQHMAKARELSASKRGVVIGKRIEVECAQCSKGMSCLPCDANGYLRTKGPRAGRICKKKFCSTMCMREYLAARFDRFTANPEVIPLPQNYDEFLTLERLPCLVPECDWIGHQLSTHMNFAHGVTAEKFKEMAGFNRGTGVVSKPLHERMCRNWAENFGDRLGVAIVGGDYVHGRPRPTARLEARQRQSKVMLLQRDIISARSKASTNEARRFASSATLKAVRGKQMSTYALIPCGRCQSLIAVHPGPNGAKYCPCCRPKQKRELLQRWKQRPCVRTECGFCGRMFMGPRRWRMPKEAGKPHYCSAECMKRHCRESRSQTAVGG